MTVVLRARRDIALTSAATPVADALAAALDSGGQEDLDALVDARPANRRDRFVTLLHIYDLHTAPLERVGARARWQHHPTIASLKNRCEGDWLAELEAVPAPESGDDPVSAMRALAARDRLPSVYRWIAREADYDQVVEFLALEGGPDAGFDDLVAACQIGLSGSAKLELATNYWDEMGHGDPDAVHTSLHDRLVAALDIRAVPTVELPESALARNALGGLLSTNRWLQPEMLGALGLIELQAGPRCRLVLQALDRCAAPADAFPFYEVHAEVDPRHGKDWLEKAIVPTIEQHPEWGGRIVRGARWRSAVNADFLDDVTRMLAVPADDDEATAA